MSRGRINAIVWCGVLLVTGGLWFFGARTRLHLVDPLAFVALVAVAAALLTGLLWWEMGQDGGDAAGDPPDDER